MSPPLRLLGTLLLVAVLAACTKTEVVDRKIEVERLVEVPWNTWGVSFEFTPADGLPAPERERARAVALIRHAEGGMGTGFFITSDGILVTSEHVVSRERCSLKRCAGVQVIRDFTPGGDFEVFDAIEVLAQDKGGDFAILRVVSDKPVKVPFLKLAEVGEVTEGKLERQDLAILGHPYGVSLRSVEARLDHIDEHDIVLRSLALPGNSGGPVLDRTTGNVVGVLKSMSIDPYAVDRENGTIRQVQRALSVAHLVPVVEKAFPLTRGEPSWDRTHFMVGPLNPDILEPADIYPDHGGGVDTLLGFIGQKVGTDDELKAFDAMIDRIGRSSGGKFEARRAAAALLVVSLDRGERLVLDNPRILRLMRAGAFTEISPKDDGAFVPLRVYAGDIEKKDCLASVAGEHSSLPFLLSAGRVCLSTQLHGRDILDTFLSAFRALDRRDRNKHELLAYVEPIIHSQARLRSLTTAQVEGAVTALDHVYGHARWLHQAFLADHLRTMLKKDAALVAPGAFAGTFKAPRELR